MNNGFDIEQRALKQLVDYNEVELAGLRHLNRSVLQPHLNHRRAVLTSALQPLAQLVFHVDTGGLIAEFDPAHQDRKLFGN